MTSSTQRRRGRKPRLSQPLIVGAAMRVLARDGLDGLTIRGIAAELGVKSASLYWHFPTRDALVDRLADELIAGLPTERATTADWRTSLRDGSCELFRRLTSVRDAARVRSGRLVTGPNTLRWMEAGLDLFRRAGLNEVAAAYASHAVHVYTVGFVLFTAAPLSAGASREAALSAARGAFAGLERATYPNLVAMAGPLTEGAPETRFLYGLDRLIDGIALDRTT